MLDKMLFLVEEKPLGTIPINNLKYPIDSHD